MIRVVGAVMGGTHDRLKRLRDAGLGDPDRSLAEPGVELSVDRPPILDAATGLLAEARALRRSLEGAT